jgi:hypothetical protein
MPSNPSIAQLKRAISITEQIESLQSELNQIFGASPGKAPAASASGQAVSTKKKRGGISAAGRAAIAAAQKARWAKLKGDTGGTKPEKKRKRKLSPEARAKIAAAAKKMWAARKSGK